MHGVGTTSAQPTPSPELPQLLVIVHGHEFATQRTPVFLRTALSSRTVPLSINVLCDTAGCRGFREAWHMHVISEGLGMAGDELSMLEEDAHADSVVEGPAIPNERRVAPLPSRMREFLAALHPSCAQRGYDYLFLKILAPELLPHADRIIVLDPDAVVLGDLADLWREFDDFNTEQLVSMSVDQSDRYYYRLQDERDEAHSPGWVGVPHRCGVNGGVVLLHAERARRVGFADAIATLTHLGARAREAGMLAAFCDLAEQDTLNYAFLRVPHRWRPLHISWNYMATARGGHRLVVDPQGTPLTFYDECVNGVVGAHGEAGDLLQCECGRRIGLLHFAGGTRADPMLARINATVLTASGSTLREFARLRHVQPASLPPREEASVRREGDHLARAAVEPSGSTAAVA